MIKLRKCTHLPSPPQCFSTGDINTMRRTAKIKQMADIRPLAIDDTDSIIRSYHLDIKV